MHIFGLIVKNILIDTEYKYLRETTFFMNLIEVTVFILNKARRATSTFVATEFQLRFWAIVFLFGYSNWLF